MNDRELRGILDAAKCPEDVFGLTDPEARYRLLAKASHPDLHGDHELFLSLQKWKELADRKKGNGTWGDMKPAILAVLRVAKSEPVELHEKILDAGGDSRWYLGAIAGTPVRVQVSRGPSSNAALKSVPGKLTPIDRPDLRFTYADVPVHSFEVVVGGSRRHVLVFPPLPPAWVSLAEVRRRIPEGVHGTHAAWMVNRFLELQIGVFGPHDLFIVQPCANHVFVDPASHAMRIEGAEHWRRRGDKPVVVEDSLVPETSFKPDQPGAGVAYAVGKLYRYLLGDQIILPELNGMISRCELASPSARRQDPLDLYRVHKELLVTAYGPPKFREFQLPTK